jgi:hypothetical protein
VSLSVRAFLSVFLCACSAPAPRDAGVEAPPNEARRIDESESGEARARDTPPDEVRAGEDPPADPPADAPPTCADRARIERAVALAIAYASEHGIASEHLADCVPARAVCADPEAPALVPPDRASECTIHVSTRYELFTIDVFLGRRDGAPRSFEAVVERQVVAPPARFSASASTSALSADGRIAISGVTSRTRHTHGGDAARIGTAEFEIENGSNAPMVVGVRRIEWLAEHSCDVPSQVRATPALGGLLAEGASSSTRTVTLAPGRTNVTVGFASQDAYYSYCDRFAARVTFTAGAHTLVATAEWEVTRVEPHRAP